MIAATAVAHQLSLATRNTKDFEGPESISSIRGRLDQVLFVGEFN